MCKEIINLTKTKGRINVNLKAMFVGDDLLVILSGGDRPHIGAVSYCETNDESYTKSFKFHKDYVLSDYFSKKIKDVFNNNFVVCAGVHLDNITKDEISQVELLSKELLDELILFIK